MQAGILVLTVSPDMAGSPHVRVEVHALALSEPNNIVGEGCMQAPGFGMYIFSRVFWTS